MEHAEALRRSFLRTYSGRNVYPLDIAPEDVDIEDIAHSLAHQCRFSGHTKFMYSVAQHSILVSHRLMHLHNNHELALSGLLHDAPEAYLVDMPTPVKKLMPAYGVAEDKLAVAVIAKFILEYPLSDSRIQWVDMELLATEARDLMGNPQDWASLRDLKPLDEPIHKWSSRLAKKTFIQSFNILMEKRNYVRKRTKQN
jgi:5'-deoxynucleotidase YfbR-like HD superfamily hydrolase